jgi:hypothetical protein
MPVVARCFGSGVTDGGVLGSNGRGSDDAIDRRVFDVEGVDVSLSWDDDEAVDDRRVRDVDGLNVSLEREDVEFVDNHRD